jgi:hypothetical protein
MKNLKERTIVIAKAGQFVEEEMKKDKKSNRLKLIKQASVKYNYSFETLKMILK